MICKYSNSFVSLATFKKQVGAPSQWLLTEEEENDIINQNQIPPLQNDCLTGKEIKANASDIY